MKKPTVYLAGPITGLTYRDAVKWRLNMASRLLPDIKAINPMHGEHSLLVTRDLPLEHHEPGELMSSAPALVTKDRFYTRSADVIYARFISATAISKMTIGECFWADAWNKPLIIGMESSGNPNDDARLRAMAQWVVDNDEDAETIIRSLLEAV